MARTTTGSKLTSQHRRRQVALAITADSQARRMWDTTINLDDIMSSQGAWKTNMLRLMSMWWKISEQEALRYLPQFREAETGDTTLVDVAIPRFNRTRAAQDIDWLGATNILWHLKKGLPPQEASRAARELFLGVFHEAVLTGGRKTVQAWTNADHRATGWRRVTDGSPCAFCAMLVTRGPVYRSEGKALYAHDSRDKYHAHCGCTVEPVYGDWKPNKLEQHWIDEYYKAAESLPSHVPRTEKTVLPLMRKHGDFRDSYFVRQQTNVQKTSSKFVTTMEVYKRRSAPRPIDWPANVYPIGDVIREHIIEGDSSRGQGGHMSTSQVIGKTHFPSDWDYNRVERAVGKLMEHPDWVVESDNLFNPTLFGAEIDGVQIEVKAYFYTGMYIPERVVPVGGVGVVRLTSDKRLMEMPKLRSKNWSKQ